MRSLGIIAFGLALLIGSAAIWYNFAYPTYIHRYRLGLEVQANGQTYSGSSVIQIRWIAQPKLGDMSPFISAVAGEAVFIEIPQHGALLAALHKSSGEFDQSINADTLAIRAFQVSGGFDAYRQIGLQTGRRDLSAENMPLLVWLPHLTDPSSARPISAADILTVLGPGARLSNAYVEMTNDPIAIDIDRKLPWLKSWADEQKRGLIITRPHQFKLVHNMVVGEDAP
jgi:hypothetical protein